MFGIKLLKNHSPILLLLFTVINANNIEIWMKGGEHGSVYINPELEIRNTTSSQINTKKIKIRYYFFEPGYSSKDFKADVWYDDAPGGTPQILCYDIMPPLETDAKKANMYCEVTFPYGGILYRKGIISLEFAIFHKKFKSYSFNEADDWSYIKSPYFYSFNPYILAQVSH